MRSANRPEGIRELTADMIRRRALLDQTLHERRQDALRPGDLVVADATEELAIQWAVIHREAGDPGRLLIVPADTFPFVAATDLEICEAATATPLILRCRHGTWVAGDSLDPALRSGTFETAQVSAAWRKYEETQGSGDYGSTSDREIDTDPEYQDWIREVLEPARAVWDDPVSPATEILAWPSSWRSWAAFGSPIGLAASVLLLISVSLAAGLVVGRQETPRRLDILFLSPQETQRGEGGELILLPSEAPRFALSLSLDPLNLYDRYRLEIRSQTTGESLWSFDPLSRDQSSYLTFELPRSLFPTGKYHLLLRGLAEDDLQLAGEYEFEIRAD